jgi:hypothetical protein
VGGFVVLVATSALLGILGDDHGRLGDSSATARSPAAVRARPRASALEQSGRADAAGVLATLAVSFFATFVALGSRACSGSSTQSIGDYQTGALVVELATIAARPRRVAALPRAAADAADRRHTIGSR